MRESRVCRELCVVVVEVRKGSRVQWEGGIMIPKNCPCWYPQKSDEEEVRTNVLGGKELNKASPKTDYGDRLAFRWGSNANAGAGGGCRCEDGTYHGAGVCSRRCGPMRGVGFEGASWIDVSVTTVLTLSRERVTW